MQNIFNNSCWFFRVLWIIDHDRFYNIYAIDNEIIEWRVVSLYEQINWR